MKTAAVTLIGTALLVATALGDDGVNQVKPSNLLVSPALGDDGVNQVKAYKGSKGDSTSSKSKGSKSKGKLLEFEDPQISSVCPNNSPGTYNIPEDVILRYKEAFEENGGTVLFTMACPPNNDCGAYDIVEDIVDLMDTNGWEAYPTPDYEIGLTDPEPYPFRTNIPVLAGFRCNEYQTPYVVFIPNTYQDAADAIKIIRQYNEEFTILSGGHDYECQSATNKALIITSLLNKIDFDFEEETVTLGAGVLWSSVYDKLKEMNSKYGVMGAQCGLVSVSGYTLGGGYSWHMSKYHGIAAETVVEMTVILANGEIVTATRKNKHRSLLWALAGSGGQQLGFVVEFRFRLFESPEGGITHSRVEYRFANQSVITYEDEPPNKPVYPWSMTRELLKGAVAATDVLLDEEKLGTIQVRYRKYRGADDDQYALEINIPCIDRCKAEQEYDSLITLLETYPPYRVRYEEYDTLNEFLLRRVNSYPSSRSSDRGSHYVSGPVERLEVLIDNSLELIDPQYDAMPDPSKIHSYFPDFNWYGVKSVIKDPSLTSINSGASMASWHITARSRNNEDALYIPIKCKIREWNALVEDTMGRYYHGSYINYLDGTAEKGFYYGTNYSRLLKIKKEYDPENVFKRIKGIAINDNDMACLEEECPAPII